MTIANLDYSAPVLRVDNQNLHPWLVRYLRPGDRYGAEFCLVHGEPRRGWSEASRLKPILQFYDYRNPGFDRDFVGPRNAPGWDKAPLLGQFVANYYVQTLRERAPGLGLCLHGSIPAWCVDAILMDRVMQWVDMLERLPNDEQPRYTEMLDAFGQ